MDKNQIPTSSQAYGPLGEKTEGPEIYTPSVLHPIPRTDARVTIGLEQAGQPSTQLPFHGVDIWTAYELSWLGLKGKPEVALGTFYIPCNSANIIESKSFKMYLNSFNQTKFRDWNEVTRTLESDLSICAREAVMVRLMPLSRRSAVPQWPGQCLDNLPVAVSEYEPAPELLTIASPSNDALVKEQLYTNLFRSRCPVTGQPDWATVIINYMGRQISHTGLLKYLVSFRKYQGFHETCIEQIYLEIINRLQPDKLTVYARFLRRGGLDINPFRSNWEDTPENVTLLRQ